MFWRAPRMRTGCPWDMRGLWVGSVAGGCLGKPAEGIIAPSALATAGRPSGPPVAPQWASTPGRCMNARPRPMPLRRAPLWESSADLRPAIPGHLGRHQLRSRCWIAKIFAGRCSSTASPPCQVPGRCSRACRAIAAPAATRHDIAPAVGRPSRRWPAGLPPAGLQQHRRQLVKSRAQRRTPAGRTAR